MDDDSEVRITLRLPAKLRDRLSATADANSRSMNGEIVERLDWSFDRATEEMQSLMKQALDAEDEASLAKRENADLHFKFRTSETERQALERLLHEAMSRAEAHNDEWREHLDVLRWVNQQMRVTQRLLQEVVDNEGKMPPALLPLVRELLEKRGTDTGFPEPKSDPPREK